MSRHRFAILLLAALFGASPVHAQVRTWVVDPARHGDARTIAEAVALIAAAQQTGPIGDRLRLMAGTYDEDLDLRSIVVDAVECPAGFESTEVRGIALSPNGRGVGGLRISGLSFREPVHSPLGHRDADWWDCRFQSGITSGAFNAAVEPNFRRCMFEGRTRFLGYVWNSGREFIDSCLFVRAPVFFDNDAAGDIGFRGCTFEGPVDTALAVRLSSSNQLHLSGCHFVGAANGLVILPSSNLSSAAILVDSCRFESITVAVLHDGVHDMYLRGTARLHVADSRFVDCRRAVWWTPRMDSRCDFARDTLARCGSPAIELVTNGAWEYVQLPSLDQLHVEGGSGDGVVIRIEASTQRSSVLTPGWIRNSHFHNNAGRGVVIERFETPPVCALSPFPFAIEGCTFTSNGADGLHVTSQSFRIAHNVFANNNGSGFVFDQMAIEQVWCSPYLPQDSILRNSAIGNRGDGITLRAHPMDGDSALTVIRNAVVANGGAGIRYAGGLAARFSGNGAWRNGDGAFVGLPSSASNFEADPGFCDPLAGDFHVQSASIYAGDVPEDGVGALGIGCDATRVELARLSGSGAAPAGSSRLLRVALLGDAFFDASRVDPSSVRMDGAPSSLRPRLSDVDRDGHVDLVLGRHGTSGVVEAVMRDGIRIRAALEAIRGTAIVDGEHEVTEDDPVAAAWSASLWPSPSRGRTFVRLVLPRPGAARLEVHDVAGRLVQAADLPWMDPGEHIVPLPARDAPGVYLVTLTGAGSTLSMRWVVTR